MPENVTKTIGECDLKTCKENVVRIYYIYDKIECKKVEIPSQEVCCK